jgi:HAD superfamily hydrolase (TIGR01549 family)
MQAPVKAVFFDIGGTLRVTRQGEARDAGKIRQMMTMLNAKGSTDDFINYIHMGEKRYRKWCKPNFVELSEQELLTRFLLVDYPADTVKANAVALNQLWRESRHKYILPDMAETMKGLVARGYKLGLISNTTSSIEGYQLLEEQGLTGIFSAVVLSAAFGRRKPHPAIFLEACRQAGVRPEECAYVGDRPSRDLLGALQSGYACTVIIHTDGYVLDEFDQDDFEPEKDQGLMVLPDHRIGRLSELLEIFPELHPADSSLSSAPSESIYDVSLSTMWGVDQPMPFEETFAAVRKIGITRFELNHKVTAPVFEQFDHNHHYVGSVHDPCRSGYTFDEQKKLDLVISSLDEEKRQKGVEIACRSIDLACQLGARSVVIHPGSIACDRSLDNQLRKLFEQGKKGSEEYEQVKQKMISHRSSLAGDYLSQVMKSLIEIAIYNSKCKGIALALENRYRYYDLPLPDELERMLGIMGGNAYGFQYDIGHAVALDALGLVPHETWLERFGSRIIGVHIHDVVGLTDHQAPGMGTVDFRKIAPYLPENCIKTLEIGPKATIPQISEGLQKLTQSGCITQISGGNHA